MDLPRTATQENLEVGESNVAKEHIRVRTFHLLPKVVRGREQATKAIESPGSPTKTGVPR